VFPIRLATYLLILEEPAGEILDQRANTVQNENIKEYILNLSKKLKRKLEFGSNVRIQFQHENSLILRISGAIVLQPRR